MGPYEYQLIQMAAGSRTAMFNERIEHMAAEGWEPILMAGDTSVNVLMRRPRQAVAARPAQAAAQPATVAPGQQ